MKREHKTRLTKLRFLRMNNSGKHSIYLYGCECGAQVEKRKDNVVSGHTRSCGCLRRETTAAKWK
jgi:predicted SprT family Zn-dependent metalloprotease